MTAIRDRERPAAPHSAGRRRRVPLVLAAVLAAIVGMVAFGLGWLVSAGDDGGGDARRERATAIIEEQVAILDDVGAFGSEEDVAALLATHAVPGAKMEDEVLGTVGYEMGFYETLFGGQVDAEIDVYHYTVAEDGSQTVILWTWHGTNTRGNPFELPGISVITHDDDGRIAHEFVTYPYPDDYVQEAFNGAGT